MFKEICVAGSSYKMGPAYGNKAKDMIVGTTDCYRQEFKSIWNCSWAGIKGFSNQYYDLIQTDFPQYIEEVRGICYGSGRQFDDTLTINCHYEITRKGGLTGRSFSMIGVESGRSVDGRTYMVGSWDYGAFQKHDTTILELTLPGDTRTCMMTEAGITSRMGSNSSEVGYYGDTLKNSHVGLKLPLHLMKRLILEQHTLEDVCRMVYTFGAGSSFNIPAGSSRGGICDFGVNSRQATELLSASGLMLHTNRFFTLGLNTDRECIKYLKNESVLRYGSLKQSLEYLERISLRDIKKALIQHGNRPHGARTHADQTLSIRKQWATICSLVMNSTERTMHIYEGNPCGYTYLETKLP